MPTLEEIKIDILSDFQVVLPDRSLLKIGQKLMKNTKTARFILSDFQTVFSRQVSFNSTKIGGKCPKLKNSNATFGVFSNNVLHF